MGNSKSKGGKKGKYPVLKISILGPPGSGKTTMLYRLKTGKMNEKGSVLLQKKEDTGKLTPVPNWGSGFNHEKIDLGNFSYDMWDVSGYSENVWEQFATGCVGVVYVVDSANEDEIGKASKSLKELLEKENYSDVPILILSNKEDVAELTIKSEAMSMSMGLDELMKGKVWQIVGCSVAKGEGLEEGFTWLGDKISENKILLQRAAEYQEKKKELLKSA